MLHGIENEYWAHNASIERRVRTQAQEGGSDTAHSKSLIQELLKFMLMSTQLQHRSTDKQKMEACLLALQSYRSLHGPHKLHLHNASDHSQLYRALLIIG